MTAQHILSPRWPLVWLFTGGLLLNASVMAIEPNSKSPFPEIAVKVQSAVVSIAVSKPRGFEFSRGKRRPRPATLQYGSGVILNTLGQVLTNNHVVDQASRIQITLSDGSEYEAEVIGQDPDTDLALVQLIIEDLLNVNRVAETGNSDSVRVGDWVMAIGSPFGFHQTVSVGVISGKGRRLDSLTDATPLPYQDFLQTDASINPGNSGGPLVNLAGQVVGINTAYNPGGVGLGFAIPINLAARVASELRENGEVVRGYLGIFPQEITSDIAEALNLSSSHGVLIGEVDQNGPAAEDGLQRGDIILELAGSRIRDAGKFLTQIAGYRPEENIELLILRDGTLLNLTVQLGRRPSRVIESTPDPPDLSTSGWPGLEVEDRWELESRRLGIPKTDQGVVVTYVVPGGPADQKGIARGDLILKINGATLHTVRDYWQNIQHDHFKPLLFLMFQKDQEHARFVALKPQE